MPERNYESNFVFRIGKLSIPENQAETPEMPEQLR